MKKIVILSIVFLSFLGFTACNQEEIETYSSTDNIYFSPSVFITTYVGTTPTPIDSTGFGFGFEAVSVKEKVYKLLIRVQGKVSNVDRKVKLTVDPLSTAVEGTNFTLPENMVMHAGKEVDTIAIKIKRTPDLKNKALTLVVNLEDNEFFTTKMKTRVTNILTQETLSFVQFKISFDDKIVKPLTWVPTYVGIFTPKKFLLMCDILQLNPVIFLQGYDQPGVSSAEYRYYGNFMRRYLADQKVAGNTIYEDDGTEMVF